MPGRRALAILDAQTGEFKERVLEHTGNTVPALRESRSIRALPSDDRLDALVQY
jgi:hypothetical protein